jgi:hypothetical protein
VGSEELLALDQISEVGESRIELSAVAYDELRQPDVRADEPNRSRRRSESGQRARIKLVGLGARVRDPGVVRGHDHDLLHIRLDPACDLPRRA